MVIPDMVNQKVEDVELGSSHTMCRMRNGKIMGWGSSKDGKLGIPGANDRNFNTPREILSLDNEKIYQMSLGPFHTVMINEEG